MYAIIGGSGLARLSVLTQVRREVMRTPYGEPSGALTFGTLAGREVVFLARHGYGHTLPPHEINYRANLWALKELQVRGVIAVASVGGMRTEGALGIYNLTKAALIHMTRQLAAELGPSRVVGIAPGLVNTDFAKVLVDNFGDRLAAALPLGRIGVPDDIAALATFLASDRASWITGETYVIDGGAGVKSS